ncbi:MAG: aldehyde dehydrogenase family protein, partial [Thermoanaerobaculia bacterium]|nr:aldehyde dehydrogenase family protein [Thermoanaerobaculia bacterium]
MTVATASPNVSALLSRLGLAAENSGGFAGEWLATSGKLVPSVNPATGEVLAHVRECSTADYEKVAAATAAAFDEWKRWPAPKRGEVVRLLGDALRRHKDDLGLLVTLEVGKIRSEGLGEVQEMIDMADFAVGLSRQLYGLSMHSERPLHRMYEQWHPLGPVGTISAFNFPVAVWAWNAMIAAVCGD